jgi:hypothetical protein
MVAMVVAAVMWAPLAAGADVPATLSGELLTGQGTGTTTSRPDFPLCNDFVNGSTQSFSVSGAATGLYPGTFTETGTFVGGFGGTFTATFTIQSGSLTITGTKSGTVTGGGCSAGEPHATMSAVGDLTYAATIHTAGGNYADQGTATTTVFLYPDDTASVGESFQSALTQPILVEACQPGHGYGDRNHCHSGPPGHSG